MVSILVFPSATKEANNLKMKRKKFYFSVLCDPLWHQIGNAKTFDWCAANGRFAKVAEN